MEGEAQNTHGGSALKALVSFFTIWQQDITQEDMDAMERGFHLVPLIGLFFSLLIAIEMIVLIVLSVEYNFSSNLVMAIVVLATIYGGSKFIHFDGLTDFGDGMIVSGTRDDHIRALKDTLVGAGGIGVALVTVLFSFSVYSMAGMYLLIFAPIVEVMVKNAMVVAAAYGTPGNGMAGRQVSMTGTDSAVKSTVLSLVLGVVIALVLSLLFNGLMDLLGMRFVGVQYEDVLFCVVIGLVVSLIAGYLMARKANSVFGMVNGDILGATNEIARPAVMFVMLLFFLAWM